MSDLRAFGEAGAERARYLRVSITDRCDLRCSYCRPVQRFREAPRSELLTLEETVEIVRIAVAQGVDKVRVTGGEPLGRSNVGWLFGALAKVPGLRDRGVTTNGVLLRRFVPLLADLGYRVNVHLDTVDPQRYREVCGAVDPQPVVSGIMDALAAGIRLKINAVILPGTSVEDALRLARFGLAGGADVRFIEAMPVGGTSPDDACREAARALEEGLIRALDLTPGGIDGVARVYDVPGALGRVGFITPSHAGFCAGCRKLRLSCRGLLRTCLFARAGTDLRPALRGGRLDQVRDLVQDAMIRKACAVGREGPEVSTMVGIGG